MTTQQIAYWNLQNEKSKLAETVRHNRSDEGIRKEANVETNRSNVQRELETHRHNYWSEQESQRHNVSTERETQRANLEREKQGRQQISINERAHSENIRSNKARETETHRHNLESEAWTAYGISETQRHNVESERETYRSNTARETETNRHNTASERLTSASIAKDYAALANQRAIANANLDELVRHNSAVEELNATKQYQDNRISEAKIKLQDYELYLKQVLNDKSLTSSERQNLIKAAASIGSAALKLLK